MTPMRCYILINSVKEQQQVIAEKEERIAALEKTQRELIARLEALELNRPSSTSGFQKTEQGVDVPLLEQNKPNGFSNKTSIKYFIPQSVTTAVINIYTSAGVKVSSHAISERGAGELVISADKYKSWIHVYDLVMHGKSMGAKKMLIE